MKMNDYNTLIELVSSLIKTEKIKEFVLNFLENEVPEYFKTIPASSSGKYHPASSLGEGGLVRHTISAVKIGHYIIGLKYLDLSQELKDSVIASLVLHDTFKQGRGDGTGFTTNDHEIVASEEIRKAGFDVIADLVSTHMGEWGKFSKIETDLQFLVHLADYLASRKTLTIDLSCGV